jgi:hypothetical protein
MTQVPHALHPGVTAGRAGAYDAARRATLDATLAGGDPGAVAAALVSEGFARLELDPADRRRLALRALHERSARPLRAVRLSFSRRHAQGNVLLLPWHVLAAARLPLLVLATGLFGVALAVGLPVGDPGTPLRAAAWGFVVCAVSMVAHETAHLAALRVLSHDRRAGAVAHSWVDVWVVGPTATGATARLTALAGPAAGALACWALGLAGAPELICWAVGAVHAANLLPVTPDGRTLIVGATRQRVGSVAAAQRDAGQRLADDAVGDQGGVVVRADGGRDHLDDVDADQL